MVKTATKPRKKAGRKSLYDKRFDAIVKLMYQKGSTDEEVAEAMSVDRTTIINWRKKHVAFFNTTKDAKAESDENVERSLFERANGYSHPEEKIFCQDGQIIRTNTTRHYPPDPSSMIFWLKNRKPGEWRDKREHELTGKDGKDLFSAVVGKDGVIADGD